MCTLLILAAAFMSFAVYASISLQEGEIYEEVYQIFFNVFETRLKVKLTINLNGPIRRSLIVVMEFMWNMMVFMRVTNIPGIYWP